ncbi:PRC-barrel domain-containing protein [Oscillatoria sp. CS-180]|uniref:PRC-barrel domain-containing protein n=1 Tax=Oscillatoria sp. CS-180 TaxID=3021720 RepID=UPI00232D7FC1|nr:PRC-barrel domain-containing protein [Oscillatoria sp. CS-180]MDB9528132.1 PRC-barrel domain-containing protein [Oscillatoria sp. CS-180]
MTPSYDQFRQRSDFLGTQVITRTTGKSLGFVSQLWVDVDRGEVVALGLREQILPGVMSGTEHVMQLSSIRQVGDVILVDDDDVVEDDLNLAPFSTMINSEVITESGEMLGRLRDLKFDVTTGKLESIVIASFGLPKIPDQVISTYELPVDEIVSSGPDRLIVFEGAEEKLVQLSVGLLERLGIGRAPWERDDDSEYIMPVPTANQLPSGVQAPVEPMRDRAPVVEERWTDDDWGTPEPISAEPMPQPLEEVNYREAPLEEDNWPAQPVNPPSIRYEDDVKEVTEDIWTDDEPEPYNAPPVNIPQKKKVTEYEEEMDY